MNVSIVFLFCSFLWSTSSSDLHISQGSHSSSSSSGESSHDYYEEDNQTPFSQQSDHPTRGEFNEARIDIQALTSNINLFKKKPDVRNLKLLVQEIADKANIAYNNEKKGTVRGTHKHTFCKDFMDKIKGKNKNTEFDNVRAEYLTLDGKSRFDVIWFDKNNKNKSQNKQKNAYVFDYKFGDDTKNKSKDSDENQYKESLKKIGYTLNGGIRDIHPSNNFF